MMNDDLTGADLLVQRFLDQDLTADERIAFLARLGRDAALREHVLDLEALVRDAARLPRPAVPDGFVARVLDRTAAAAPPPSWWQRLRDLCLAPRTLQWNLAGAAAGVCAAIALGLLAISTGLLDREGAAQAAADDLTPVLVRLVVVQPGARSVAAAGDFNGWNPDRTPLQPLADGAWAVTIPLPPGRYEYMFVVDGDEWIADPFASEQTDDGFGSRNAVLEVRNPEGRAL